MADHLHDQDLERFMRDFALFHRRFLHGTDAAAAPRPPAGTMAAPAAAGAPPRRPVQAKPPRRAA